MSGNSRASSVASFLSSASQKKIAELEAQEEIVKMEAEIHVEIERKQEAISNYEKKISRSERGLAKFKDLDMDGLSEKEKSSYSSLKESIDDSKFEIGLLQNDILNLQQRAGKRKKEILERQQLKLKKIDVIEEDEKNEWCSAETEKQQGTSEETVKKWVEKTNQIVEPPPLRARFEHQFSESVRCDTQLQGKQFGFGASLFPPPPPPPVNMMGAHLFGQPNINVSKTGGLGFVPPPNSQFMDKSVPVFVKDSYQYPPPPQMNNMEYPPPPTKRSDEMEMKMMALMEAQMNLLSRSGTGGNLTGNREVVVKTSVDKDLPHFYGNPAQFNNFKSAYNRSTAKYNFDQDENMMRLQKALKGEAKKKVSHLMANPLNLEKLLKTLEESYGRPEFVLDYLVEKVKSCDRIEVHKPASLVAFGDTVEALVTNVCSYNKKDYMYNKQLTKELVDKLPGPLKTRWFEWRAEDETRETNLLCFSSWLELRVKAARLQLTPSMKVDEEEDSPGMRKNKRGPATANVAVTDPHKKHCVECEKGGHTILDCRRFAKRTNHDKWNFVKEKKLCFLCLRFGHRTGDCRSGIKCSIEECDKKHNSILHYSGGKKIKDTHPTPRNSSSESESEEEQPKPSGSGMKLKQNGSSSNNYTTAGASVVEGTDGALPIIPVWLNGPKGTIKTYALLDTGASRSLIEEGLAEELGLNGKEFEFSCRGFGGTLTKHRNAKKVDLNIGGYFRGSKYSKINDVITVKKIGIAPYSLDLHEARRRWPCLRRIKGRSMKEVVPQIIIGSPHRHLTIPREILCSRLGGPVVTRTILGWVFEGDLIGTGSGTMLYVGGYTAELDNQRNNLQVALKIEDFDMKPSVSELLEDNRALQITEATKVKVPKLELQAAVLGSKLAASIANEIKITIDKKYFWSDSRTVLSWIRSQSARQPEFIANRIGAIQDSTNIIDWRWIPTAENVADDATRINKPTEFEENARWFTGPTFLKLNEDKWPSDKKEDESIDEFCISCGDSFGAGASSDGSRLKEGAEEMAINDMKKFSSYTSLLHVVSAVYRVSRLWLSKLRARKEQCNVNLPLYLDVDGKKTSTATDADLIEAQQQLVKWVQKEEFTAKGVLRKDKKMKKLCPYFDECGVLRARGRIDNSNVTESTRRPIILPARHHLTDLIVDDEHRRNAHTGQDTVLNNLRKTFWILDGRQAIRRCCARCNYCRILRAKPMIPEMGGLPSCRLASGTYPFTYTGVDYFGPIEVTVGRRHEKRWGVLFCCMVTRAIHLEVAHGLSTDETILALSRLVDSRRRPQTIFSDNGSNFHGAIRELEQAIKAETYKKIMENTGLEKMEWKFIPPAAAHMGGAWERLIQAVKKVIKVVLHDKFPRDTVLLTVFKAAENIVNSRPMTYLSSDVEDPDPLTPNHFVKGGVDLGPTIPAEVETRASYFRQKWKEAQALANMFWERWTIEYLPTLLKREKWTDQVEPVDVGDLVLIVDEQLPRNCWVKAVVTATFPGKDGQVRAVEVTTRSYSTKKKTTLKRPVTKLCPLGLRVGKSAVMTSNLGAGVKEREKN